MIYRKRNGLYNQCPIENVRYNIQLIIDDCEFLEDDILEEVDGYLGSLIQLSQWTDFESFIDSDSRLMVIIYEGPDDVYFQGESMSFDVPAYCNPTVDVDWAHEGF